MVFRFWNPCAILNVNTSVFFACMGYGAVLHMEDSLAFPTTPASPTPQPRRNLRFDWVIPVLIHPKQAFAEIAAQTRGVWLTPLLIMTVAALLYVLMAGSIQKTLAETGTLPIPEAAQWWTPEQLAQYQQAMMGMNNPVFYYVLPALRIVISVWMGWLIVGALLHLLLTLFGGRSSMGVTLNVVAWASLPIALRYLVQFGKMMQSNQFIQGQGLAGFAPSGEGIVFAVMAIGLGLIDLYVIWQMVLMVIGIKASSALTTARAVFSVLLTIGILLVFQIGLGYATSLFSQLTVVRPF
jgi:hypothetical protein